MKSWSIVVGIVGVLAILYYLDQEGTDLFSDTNDVDTGDVTGMTTFDNYAQAIIQAENANPVHNNPFGLTAAAAVQVGAVSGVDFAPYVVSNGAGGTLTMAGFFDYEDGVSTGQSFLQQFIANHQGLTVQQATALYTSGSTTGAVGSKYLNAIQQALGSLTATLGSIFPNE